MSDSFYPQTIDLTASAVQLIRTALNNPKVTLDKTGLKSYDANGNLVVAINADGSASFVGTVKASGLNFDAPLSTTIDKIPAVNKVQWARTSDGVAIAEIFAYQDLQGDHVWVQTDSPPGQQSEINMRALAGDSGGAALLSVRGNTAIPNATVSVTGPGTKTILDGQSKSDFMQVANGPAQLAVALGSTSIAWPGATPRAANATVNHNLPRTPTAVLTMASQGAFATASLLLSVTATQLTLSARTTDGSNPAAGNSTTIYWLVIG